MNFVRLLIFGFIGLTVVYVCVSLYSRSVRREKLEKRWDEDQPEGITRAAYVAEGMAKYEAGLRKKLILLIYVVPPIVVGTIITLVNN